jgi:hypothetical protein
MRLSYLAGPTVAGMLVFAQLGEPTAVVLDGELAAGLRGGGFCQYVQDVFVCSKCVPIEGGGSQTCNTQNQGGPCVDYSGSACLSCTNGDNTTCGTMSFAYSDDFCNNPYEMVPGCTLNYTPYNLMAWGGSCDTDSCEP